MLFSPSLLLFPLALLAFASTSPDDAITTRPTIMPPDRPLIYSKPMTGLPNLAVATSMLSPHKVPHYVPDHAQRTAPFTVVYPNRPSGMPTEKRPHRALRSI